MQLTRRHSACGMPASYLEAISNITPRTDFQARRIEARVDFWCAASTGMFPRGERRHRRSNLKGAERSRIATEHPAGTPNREGLVERRENRLRRTSERGRRYYCSGGTSTWAMRRARSYRAAAHEIGGRLDAHFDHDEGVDLSCLADGSESPSVSLARRLAAERTNLNGVD